MIRAIVKINNTVATVGINEELSPVDFSIYPNPSTGQLNLHFQQGHPEKFALRIVDLQGRKVYFKIYPPDNQLNAALDLSYLSNGVYLIQIIKNGEVFSRQWVKK